MSWLDNLKSLKEEIRKFNDNSDGFYRIEMDDFLKEFHVVKNRKTIPGNNAKFEKEAKRIKKLFFELIKEMK